ncbi:hypothetical protein EVAR_20869_1 [Eumeta japonica]|uniref:Uncharacterized protein n=1 Tax=Eumeta variegata TaxID=151549 RepID=A0A4C1UVV6_EUMVA|nr:hypothetical protein EVAR_20869_1 [Eumeta japonica]
MKRCTDISEAKEIWKNCTTWKSVTSDDPSGERGIISGPGPALLPILSPREISPFGGPRRFRYARIQSGPPSSGSSHSANCVSSANVTTSRGPGVRSVFTVIDIFMVAWKYQTGSPMHCAELFPSKIDTVSVRRPTNQTRGAGQFSSNTGFHGEFNARLFGQMPAQTPPARLTVSCGF